jgi:transposase-like protein
MTTSKITETLMIDLGLEEATRAERITAKSRHMEQQQTNQLGQRLSTEFIYLNQLPSQCPEGVCEHDLISSTDRKTHIPEFKCKCRSRFTRRVNTVFRKSLLRDCDLLAVLVGQRIGIRHTAVTNLTGVTRSNVTRNYDKYKDLLLSDSILAILGYEYIGPGSVENRYVTKPKPIIEDLISNLSQFERIEVPDPTDCPKCNSLGCVTKFRVQNAAGVDRFFCLDCQYKFSRRSGTIFEKSKRSDQQLLQTLIAIQIGLQPFLLAKFANSSLTSICLNYHQFVEVELTDEILSVIGYRRKY